jgi:hypothetical protein
MNFEKAYQQYCDENDPDHFTSMEALFRWFYEQGAESKLDVARQCEERMMRYGEQAKFARTELDDVIHTRDSAFSAGKTEAAKEMLEMLEAFQTSYDLIGYEVETVGTIASRFSKVIKEKFGL